MEQNGDKNAPERSLNALTKFVCSYFAACIAQTSTCALLTAGNLGGLTDNDVVVGTYPLDTIRRRIQTDGYVSGSHAKLQYTGVVATARIILAREGWRGLFKGVSVNWMRVRPSYYLC